ncbi:MAG TPA: hypothetical protein VFE51_31480 [Verrucomicrobiae bacterium]|nr:hypothetical protein [Verrucomicrobiae bacterium]
MKLLLYSFADECLHRAITNDTILADICLTASLQVSVDALDGFTTETVKRHGRVSTKERLCREIVILDSQFPINNQRGIGERVEYGPEIVGTLLSP